MATFDTHQPARHRNHMAGVGIRRLVELGFEANPTLTPRRFIVHSQGSLSAEHIYSIGRTIPMTPAELFTAAGRALYGDEFVAALAAELQEDDDTVGNWAAGKSRVLPGVWLEFARLIQDRAEELPALKVAVLELANPESSILAEFANGTGSCWQTRRRAPHYRCMSGRAGIFLRRHGRGHHHLRASNGCSGSLARPR
jgi:hypothetical protein